MVFVMGPELLAASAIGAGVCGYIIGDLRSAIRRLDAEDLETEEFANLFAYSVPQKVSGHQRNVAEPIMAKSEKPVTAHANNGEPKVMAPVPIKPNLPEVPNKSKISADMPPLEELRAQVRKILETDDVWGEPENLGRLSNVMRGSDEHSRRLVDKYRHSIEELRRANALQRSLFIPFADGEVAADISAEADLHVTLQSDPKQAE